MYVCVLYVCVCVSVHALGVGTHLFSVRELLLTVETCCGSFFTRLVVLLFDVYVCVVCVLCVCVSVCVCV